MSKKKILHAIAEKGLSFEVCEYDRQATPHGMMPGWSIQLDDQSVDLALDYGADFADLEPDCESAAEVLDWIASLPDCFDGASSADPAATTATGGQG